MAFYIKVTKQVADKLGLTEIRNATADGNVLLWQADVAQFEGDTVFDRAGKIGGVCLYPQQAKEEIDGTTDSPVPVTTPDEYKDAEDDVNSDENIGELEPDTELGMTGSTEVTEIIEEGKTDEYSE